MNPRIKKIYSRLAKEGLDGLIVSSSPNISYLTDFTSRDSFLLISKKGNIYITDSRYTEEAERGLKGSASIAKVNGSFYKSVADGCLGLGLRQIGFEERYLSFCGYREIKKGLNKSSILIPAYGIIEELRQVKAPEEIKKIRKATQITIEAFRFIEKAILPGKKETEISGELERFIRRLGAHSSAFDIIVGSGPNSSLPHHLTSERKIKNNEPVLIDMGVDYMGYKSDLTRVFFLGKINHAVNRIYQIVRRAQDRAIKKIRPAVAANKVDRAARRYITQSGYGGFFGHSLGHGVGLEVHEEPRVSAKNDSKLKKGMVFTVEPGIYLPGKFGIRLEDMVLVTEKGCEVISGTLHK